MKIIVAAKGQYLETLGKYAGTSVAVLPYGVEWKQVVTSDDPFAELLQCPIERFPIDPLELS